TAKVRNACALGPPRVPAPNGRGPPFATLRRRLDQCPLRADSAPSLATPVGPLPRQLAERGAPVLGVARDPVKARGLLPAAAEIRAGDVTDPGSLSAARLGACCAIFFAVDITGGVGGRGF